MNQQKETIYISIANQKGGMGKSGTTHILGKTLVHQDEMSVAIIEVDSIQRSLTNLLDDVRFQNENESLNPPYDLSVAKDLEHATQLLKECNGKYDVVFLDIPGTLEKEGIILLMKYMHYVIMPFCPDISNYNYNSTMAFLAKTNKTCEALKAKGLPVMEILAIITRTTPRKRTHKDLHQDLKDQMKGADMQLFESCIKEVDWYGHQHSHYENPLEDRERKRVLEYKVFYSEFKERVGL